MASFYYFYDFLINLESVLHLENMDLDTKETIDKTLIHLNVNAMV